MPEPASELGARGATVKETVHGATQPVPLGADLRAGTDLAGYRLFEVVGRGGMGVVYRAEHRHLGRVAALKVLAAETESPAFRERFVRESRIAASLQHPNIVTVFDAGEAEGLLYIAMQYVDGTDLAAALEENGPLEPDRALSIVGQVADALDAAHSLGLVHRDVKPANVLLEGNRSFLTDFGLTRRVSGKTSLTAHGQFVGTIDYMPPEQIQGQALDARADVYALGCLLHHMLSGATPFPRETQVAVMYAHLQDAPPTLGDGREGLPPALDEVIARAMAKKKEDRYGTCGELVAAVRDAFAPKAEVRSLASVRARQQNVVVADDDPLVRATIRVSLDPQRFRVLEADDARSAVELARKEHAALVFVNFHSAEPDAEVCRALRADPETSTARIIALTPRLSAAQDAALRSAGVDASLPRPFSSLQVRLKVAQLLSETT